MTRIDWTGTGQRFFEAGVDRGVLYVGSDPGVPWIGLVKVDESRSGGKSKPRYLDGVKISNGFQPQEFEAKIEAFTYPAEFEVCDGTKVVANGLRVTQQRRKPFNLVYRSRIGNDVDGLDHAYKIHILYNIMAEPTDREYETLSDDNSPITFSWDITTRGEPVLGLFPSAHYTIDSRDTPVELLLQIEDILYGSDEIDPRLPGPGELGFIFDSFEDFVYDAGSPLTPVFEIFDAGSPSTPVTTIIDGGAL